MVPVVYVCSASLLSTSPAQLASSTFQGPVCIALYKQQQDKQKEQNNLLENVAFVNFQGHVISFTVIYSKWLC